VMKRFVGVAATAVLAVLLYSAKVLSTILTLALSSAVAAPFVMLASYFVSVQSDGAFPAFGYLVSLGVSFILIFTSYVGARGAAQVRD